MIFEEAKLAGAMIIDLELRGDERGFFARSWCQREFEEQGLNTGLVQANISMSRSRGTLRGMHYQAQPFAETKLIRCTRGAIYDVVIDLRPDSRTFRQWIGVELTEENHRMLYVPEDFAHGFLTLEDDSEVSYLVTEFYTPDAERGVRYNDPAFGIDWPGRVEVVSAKDAAWPDFLL